MKRPLVWNLPSFFALAGLAACDPGGSSAANDAAASPAASATASAKAEGGEAKSKSHGNGARSVAEETDDFLFEYAYPGPAGRIPELAEILDARLDKQRADLAAEAEQARQAARQEGFPYNKHSYTAEWKVVADLPKWLSLSMDMSTYTGGAHGNSNTESLVWDKERKRTLAAKALFTSPAALEDALGDRFCDALDRERAKRRGEPVAKDEPGEGDDFLNGCPKMDELTLLLGSSNGRTFNRLTLYAGPYVAGPYVEGAYRIDLPIDRAVLAVVKPEYKDAFSARN